MGRPRLAGAPAGGRPRTAPLRVALLHLSPRDGDLAANRAAIEAGLDAAAAVGARWVVTPELAVSGYTFHEQEGTGFVAPQPDPWVRSLGARLARHRQTLFLGLPERDPGTDRLYNTLLVLGPGGVVLGRHRKVAVLPVGSEAWSSPGAAAAVVEVPPVGKVGLLLCADAHRPALVEALAAAGARLVVSAANWAPGFHGPDGEWERASAAIGGPVLVCNRTGEGRALDFRGAQSVVAVGGRRVVEHASADPALLIVDLRLSSGEVVGAPRALPLAL